MTADWRSDAEVHRRQLRLELRQRLQHRRGKIESSTLLLNGYVDLGNWYGITPYVGAGVGVAQQPLPLLRRSGHLPDACLRAARAAAADADPEPHENNLAWAVMAGVAVDLGYGFKLDVGYRFVHVGDARTGVDTFGVGSKAKALDAQEVRLGVRYVID